MRINLKCCCGATFEAEAREGVRLQVPRAKVILALVKGGKGARPVAPGTEAA